jgi:ribonuclease VapC
VKPLVLDSSAVLAILLAEVGHQEAAGLAEGGMISAVNVAEIVTKCVEFSYPEDMALQYIHNSNIAIIDFDVGLATLAGVLRRNAGRGVLSLGDRACIALALRENGIAVTGDQVWSTLQLGVEVRLIR